MSANYCIKHKCYWTTDDDCYFCMKEKINKLESENKALKSAMAEAMKAIDLYSNEAIYNWYMTEDGAETDIDLDGGKLARETKRKIEEILGSNFDREE